MHVSAHLSHAGRGICGASSKVSPSIAIREKLPVCEAARIAAYRHDPDKSIPEVDDVLYGGSAIGTSTRQVLHPPSSNQGGSRSSIVPIQQIPSAAAVRNDASASQSISQPRSTCVDQMEQQQEHQPNEHVPYGPAYASQQAVLAPVPHSHNSAHRHASTYNGNGTCSKHDVVGQQGLVAHSSTAQGTTHSTPPHYSRPPSPPPPQPMQQPPSTPAGPIASGEAQQHSPGAWGQSQLHGDSQHINTLCYVLDELEGLVRSQTGRSTHLPQGNLIVKIVEYEQQPSSSTTSSSSHVSHSVRNSRVRQSKQRPNVSPSSSFLQPLQHSGKLLQAIQGCTQVWQLQQLAAHNMEQLEESHVVALAKRLAQIHIAKDSPSQKPPFPPAVPTSQHPSWSLGQGATSFNNTANMASSMATRTDEPGAAANVAVDSVAQTTDKANTRSPSTKPASPLSSPAASSSSPQRSPSPAANIGESLLQPLHPSSSPPPPPPQQQVTAAASASPLQWASPAALQLWGVLLDKMLFLTPLVSLQQAADMLQALSVVRPMADAVAEVHAASDRARALALRRRRLQQQWEADKSQADEKPPDAPQQQQQVEGGAQDPKPTQSNPQSLPSSSAAALSRAVPEKSGTDEDRELANHRRQGQSRKQRHPSFPPLLPKPLNSGNRQLLVEGLLLHSQRQLPGASPETLTQIVHAVAMLCARPPASWLSAYWEASSPRLSQHTTQQLLSVCQALGHLGASPPKHWLLNFYAATRPCLRSLDVVDISKLVHGTARLPMQPGQGWMAELLMACEGQLDELDAPAYALLVHGLGCMGHVPPRGWLDELLESAASLMHDFSPEELSLLLRGLAYLDVRPHPSLAAHIWATTEPKLRTATGPQLANIGWAAVALLDLRPPRSWVSAWLSTLARASSPTTATAAAAVVLNRAGSGGSAPKVAERQQQGSQQMQQQGLPHWQPLRRKHALRAADTLAALKVPQLDAWCVRLRVPTPKIQEEQELPNAVALAARATKLTAA